ncbi:hypothetical protein EIN_367530 [Entamoeba invadens IP1]|uniref:Protein serine/threonine kinase n=1 Tax=Entamoeba invadens IP1 TaxID=370355 RepID=L7FJN1_ENTIV|nr:hypothetical protein EIN_367530 [Entamoeba invadens IP1]ELP84118.1 hypothetical protein EIN_367530 [Entamoeba invadens IP1]|eukprot:XP_004183464.1 hypothetical protein EIN_367530 [Entamoeba invadens IP1]
MKFMLFVMLMFTTNGYHCDCTTTHINNLYDFNPSTCSVNTSSICFSTLFRFNFNDYIFFKLIILDNTMFYSTTDQIFWINTKSLTITENTSLFLMADLNVNNNIIIETKASMNMIRNSTNFGSVSIAGNLILSKPELNNPQIVLWNTSHLHLSYNHATKPNFEIANPTGNTNCFDVISLNAMSNLDTLSIGDHIMPDMFNYSFNFTDGKGYLISNKKLIRFCPNTIPFNNEVICTLKNVDYNPVAPDTMEGSFDYPHCPCNKDDNVLCKLRFVNGIIQFNMLKFLLNNTELVVNKDMKLLNLKFAKQVTIYDNVVLTVNSLFLNLVFSFTFGKITTNQNKDEYKDTVFNYSPLLNTLYCLGDLNYNFSIYQNITNINININSTGNIKNLYLYENTNVLILKNTILNSINQVEFSEDGKSFVFMENASNNKVINNCHLMEVLKTGLKCVMCNTASWLDNDICNSLVYNCERYNKNNVCVLCKTGFVLNEKFECVYSTNCLYGTTSICSKCRNQYIRDDNECIYNDKCRYTDGSNCIECITGNLHNKCESCTPNCYLCSNKKCLKCNDDFFLDNESVCVKENNGFSTGISTIWCNDEFYIDNGVCNKCSSKFANSIKCDNTNAISCEVNYSISNERKCTLSVCQNETFKEQNGMCTSYENNCIFVVNSQCSECENNYTIGYKKTCVNITTNTLNNCVIYSKYGCISCKIGYYLSNAECHQCSEKCTSCIESDTKCLLCVFGYYQGDNYTCLPSTELIEKCDKISIITGGCYQCKEGYYRVGMDCIKCLSNCSICNTIDTCLSCNLTNYKTQSGNCLPQNSIIGCAVEITQNGCSKCLDGYYTVNNNECEKCNNNCTTCTQHDKCNSCVKNRILFENGICLDISYVLQCIEVLNSKCSKCTFWHSPNKSGTTCNKKAVWWVILFCVIFTICVLIILMISMVCLIKTIERKVLKFQHNQNTIFKINHSNINFIAIGDDIVVNKTGIVFGGSENPIKVGIESRELICVGNLSKRHLKIQFSMTDKTEKYTIRTEPQVVSLSKRTAVEFEIFVKPNCSCKINDRLTLFSKNLQDSSTKNNQISLTIITEMSTRLDPDELYEDKKLGEGSFGIVYKGSFRKI